MKYFDDFCNYLSSITSIHADLLAVILVTIFILVFFSLFKFIFKRMIRKRVDSNRKVYFLNQSSQVILNIVEVILLFLIWCQYFRNLMTLISVISAAMTIALREIIMNFFCGIYIRFKKPFKVEDRIEVDGIKGDVMNISLMDFEILEVSNQEANGQSTGVVVNFSNSVIFSKPIKNINKGFKYIWNELMIPIRLDCDLVKNKQELYKIVNENETIKSIPRKMMGEIRSISSDNRVYFNQYDPVIYMKIHDYHIELTIRYLMHPKKARYIESVLWNKIYQAFLEGRIDLFLGDQSAPLDFQRYPEETYEKFQIKEEVEEDEK